MKQSYFIHLFYSLNSNANRPIQNSVLPLTDILPVAVSLDIPRTLYKCGVLIG